MAVGASSARGRRQRFGSASASLLPALLPEMTSSSAATARPLLRRLRIENLVLIRDAELAFAPGLNAITGETGAGKTILAQAVGLLLGTKGDDSFVGAGADEAYVEAELDIPDGLLEEEAFECCWSSGPRTRRASSSPRDRRRRTPARVRLGRSAAREDVAALGERLLAMSGQFEQRRLCASRVPARGARPVLRRRAAAAAPGGADRVAELARPASGTRS